MSFVSRPLRLVAGFSGMLVATTAWSADRESAVVPEPTPEAIPGCGTSLTPAEAAAYIQLLEDREPSGELLGGPYYVPIAPHIVRQSDGTGGLSEARYQQAVADANGHFAGAGIVFYTTGAIDYIDSDDFYTTSTLAEIDDLRTTNTVPDAINIYFSENLNYESGGLCGISAFTFSSVQAIAMRNSCTANPAGLGNHSTFSHEIGHYFNLFHTHETALGDELVDGTNCSWAGDELCDTPADPRLGSSTVSSSTCLYTGSETDSNGDPYAPDATLLMSYSLKHCRDHFSPQSLVRAEDTLVTERPNLITNPVATPEFAEAAARLVSLSAPRPNPSSGMTELEFSLVQESMVDITVYDVRGVRVRTIARSRYSPGTHVAGWDGRDELGQATAPGIYFARLSAAGDQVARKIQRVH
ncbi:MAG: hypothetical protein DHS20C21_03240 [Gemmatimonadota bacterium]|nr:MAG: hypothetical protein DHS20C21_03240 [Gemmatimonadota bacterium]